MTNEQIRAKIKANPQWNGTLIGFENNICEVEFYGNHGHYSIYPKGKPGMYDDLLTTLDMTSIESLVAFMQGASYLYHHPVKDIKELKYWALAGNKFHLENGLILTLFNEDEDGNEYDSVYINLTEKEGSSLSDCLIRFLNKE